MKRRAFTLVEVLIVIAIIAILAAILAPVIVNSRAKAWEKKTAMIMMNLGTALNNYRVSHDNLMPPTQTEFNVAVVKFVDKRLDHGQEYLQVQDPYSPYTPKHGFQYNPPYYRQIRPDTVILWSALTDPNQKDVVKTGDMSWGIAVAPGDHSRDNEGIRHLCLYITDGTNFNAGFRVPDDYIPYGGPAPPGLIDAATGGKRK